MHQGAVSACYVSETERSVLATRDISALSQRFFPSGALLWLEWNNYPLETKSTVKLVIV